MCPKPVAASTKGFRDANGDVEHPIYGHVRKGWTTAWQQPPGMGTEVKADFFIKALDRDPEVWKFLDGIIKEPSESLNLWTVIEKCVCQKEFPVYLICFTFRGPPTPLENAREIWKGSSLWDNPCPFDKLSSFNIPPCMTLDRDVSINPSFSSKGPHGFR
jgi:hypothetical protein